ncbi:hypothetical protein [Methyloceanibacter superfactus]|uniref:hypothetical protein n=1 Tax=Methyloceanibacter superfactus TaxID=1774969 RepID=UPI00114D12B7|nr:hypothetical protein [Methyloceanibacter superfactus]
MRSTMFAFLLAFLAMTFGGTPADAEEVRCQAIRDSAMCVSEPNCWYDAANNKGCLPGPARRRRVRRAWRRVHLQYQLTWLRLECSRREVRDQG